jgi:hypothetical protein
VQKCKSPESEDSDEATFVQKSGTFAEAHAKVEDGDDPKAEPPTRGRESGEQLASVRELVRQGMSPTWARAEVLGPISAQPEEGEREVTPENLDEYMEQNRARMPNPPAPGQKRFEPGGRYDQMVPVVQLYYQQERRKGANHLDALALAIKFEEALEAARVEQEAREAACAHENTRRSD